MKIKNSDKLHKSILLIGPSPPPFVGARVSFQLFLDYLMHHSSVSINYFDLPVLSETKPTPTGRVDHVKTILGLVNVIPALLSGRSVVIFASRGFCFSYGLILSMVSRLLGKHCYIRFFGGHPVLYLQKFPNVLRRIIFLGLKSAYRLSIATKIGASEFPEFLRKKFQIIPGYRPVIPAKFSSRSAQDDTFRFVYAGAISEEKGIDVLLKSFSKLHINAGKVRSLELHLYGRVSSHLLDTLLEKSGVHWHGEIDNIVLRRQLSSFNVFVFPSVYDNEGHPGVLIEALMAGLPIISSDQPVIRELLFDNVNSLIVEPGDIRGLSRAMNRLVNDSALRKKLSKAALETSSKFDAANVLPELAKALGL
jgi:glycosyltransferase involved in cell wall biosynthesis